MKEYESYPMLYCRKMVLVSVSVLLLFGCRKKNELVIRDSPSDEPSAVNEELPESDRMEMEKPLIALSDSDTLLIMVRQDGAPGMYLGEDDKLHGFYVDLEKMIMDEMGQAYRLIPYSDVGPIILKLKSGEVHSALAAPDLADYRSFLNLSVPYEILNYVTFIRKGDSRFDDSSRDAVIQSLEGKKVGVQAQGHIYQLLRDNRNIELVEYPTTTMALEDLNKGLLDAVPDVKRIGEYYAGLKGWEITPVGGVIFSHKITTAFSQMLAPALLEKYNTALTALMDQGKVRELYESYFAPENLYTRP